MKKVPFQYRHPVTFLLCALVLFFCMLGVFSFTSNNVATASVLDVHTSLHPKQKNHSYSEQKATLLTKDGQKQPFNPSQTIPEYIFSTGKFNQSIAIRPCYKSVDAAGNVVYRESLDSVSVTDHGLWNHKKVHIWKDKHATPIVLEQRLPYDSFNPPTHMVYNLREDGSAIALFTLIEVTDKSAATYKYLRGTSYGVNTNKPWQKFHFVFYTAINGRKAWLVKMVNEAGQLPIGLKNENAEKNGVVLETKPQDSSCFWVIEIVSYF